jgi:hypothetical protein
LVCIESSYSLREDLSSKVYKLKYNLFNPLVYIRKNDDRFFSHYGRYGRAQHFLRTLKKFTGKLWIASFQVGELDIEADHITPHLAVLAPGGHSAAAGIRTYKAWDFLKGI